MKLGYVFALAAVATSTSSRTKPDFATIVTSRDVSDNSYDFIIAGGGVSGLTVADRLTENPSVNVLVIEAGPFDKGENTVLVPGDFFPVPYMWIPLLSVPQPGLNNRVFNAKIGKVVGGGSVINGMVFVRPQKEELADWTELGATGWDWDSLLPYYKKSENFTAPDPTFARAANFSYDERVHGRSGPVQCSYPNFYFPGSENWYEAAISSSLRPVGDMTTGNAAGVSFFPTIADFTTRTRSHAGLSHYQRVKQRPNYHLLAEHSVSQILFEGKKAVGVEYLPTAGGSVSTATAKKEVILASGAIHTPKILQLSGVGPRKLLERLGIKVVVDLPGVGSNFHDQPSMIIPYNVTNNITPNYGSLASNTTYAAEQRRLYNEHRSGPLVLTGGLSTNLALSPFCNMTNKCTTILDAAATLTSPSTYYLPADTDATVLAGYQAQRSLLLRQLRSETPAAMIHWDTASAVHIFLLKPLSRGTIQIASSDPLQPPVIDPRTFSDPFDLELGLAAVLKNRHIMSQPTMSVLQPFEGAPLGNNLTNEEEIKRALAHGLVDPSSGHPCCTAAMMPRNLGGVVGPDMKVYGTEGLRVVDVSSWPFVLTAAPTATVFAGGEKIADEIKKEYGLGDL